ncbi:MAG: helicase HerA-like domain-containing protein [Methylocystis sp.]
MTDDPNALPDKILVAASGKTQQDRAYRYLLLPLGNRHGLISGATGGGKTVSLQRLAEGFSKAGTAVFLADVKGDLAGLSQPGDSRPAFVARAKDLGLNYAPEKFPVVFWDVFGEQGHPVRATIAEMGPLLLSRLLDLNDTQEGVLNIVFRIADEQGLLLYDLKDLRAVLGYVADNASDIQTKYGNVAPATIGAVQRQLLVIETQGGDKFFGEPALDLKDFIAKDNDGRGYINILAADKLMRAPRLYATFLLWMLTELFAHLPEVGDLDTPKLVFFFDEAHLLFTDAPKNLLTAIEQVVRLIRSKGVGVYFVTQNPLDVPDTVLGQLGNRVQHALRAFTPRDQKAVRAAAETFRQNKNFDTAEAIMQLGVGEALVSMLDAKGTPEMVDRALVAPPNARVGTITPEERKAIIENSPLYGLYDTPMDRESAYEVLQKRAGARMETVGANPATTTPAGGGVVPSAPVEASTDGGILGRIGGAVGGLFTRSNPKRMSAGELAARAALQSAARSIGTTISREVIRNIFGGMSR